MKIVFAVLAVMPLLAHAAPAAARDASRPPLINRPPPNPPCGDYWDDCGEKGRRDLYLLNLKAKTAGLSVAIADGKLDKADETLNGLFTGAGSKEKGSESSAVAAGAWTVEPWSGGVLTKHRVAPRRGEMLPLIERGNGERENGFKIMPVGLKEEAAKEIIEEVVKEAIPVVKEVVKKADQALSDKLTAPDTERARQEYGGCRMKGTCSK